MNNFNKIYEEYLQTIYEQNAGIVSSKKIVEIKNVLLTGWNNLLNTAKELNSQLEFNIIKNKPELSEKSHFIKFSILYNKYVKEIGMGGGSLITINGIQYKLVPTIQVGEGSSDNIFSMASTSKSPTFSKDKIIQSCIYVNGDSYFDEIEKHIQNLTAFALHEASHIYDIGINRNKTGKVQRKYLNAISDKLNNSEKENTNKDYVTDLELIAYTGSTIEEVLLQRKNNPNITFKVALSNSDSWRMISKVYPKDSKQYKRQLNKVLFAWNNYEEFI